MTNTYIGIYVYKIISTYKYLINDNSLSDTPQTTTIITSTSKTCQFRIGINT